MNLNITSFGIAREIIGNSSIKFVIEESYTLGALKTELVAQFPEFKKLVRFSLAVNEEYQEDSYILKEGDEVVVIPPVSGG